MTDNLATNSQGQNESASPGVASAQVEGDEQNPSTEQAEGEEGQGTQQTEEELDELEYEGKKYRVPKALKAERLMHADYTRKTQEIAEQRKALEAQASQHVQRDQEIIKGYGKMHALDESIAQYQKVNWGELNQQDPQLAQTHWMQFQQLKDQRGSIERELQQKEHARGVEQQRSYAKLVEESRAVLARDIGLTPELDEKLYRYGTTELGLTRQDFDAMCTDPRFLKVIHRAWKGDQAAKENAALKKASATADVKPLSTVGSNSSAQSRRTTDPSGDKLPIDVWMKREKERIAKRK